MLGCVVGTNGFLHQSRPRCLPTATIFKASHPEPISKFLSMKSSPGLDLEISPLIIPESRSLILPATSEITRGAMILISVVILAGYHIRLFRAEKAGKPSWRTSQAQTRQDWSAFVRKSEGWLYAVQTLRNAITANTFLATTVISLLTLISGKLWEMIRSLNANSYLQYTGIMKSRNMLVIQFASVALSMLSSAYEFLQSARLMTHAGFMFPAAKGAKVDLIMRKSENAQWLGLRYLYISLAVICWIVCGEGGLLASSLALLQFFRMIDRVPKEADSDETYL